MSHDLSDIRLEYISRGLQEDDLSSDPVQQFAKWFYEVLELEIDMANAMIVATVDEHGSPDARYVLLKEYSEEGFIFYTSSLSQKGKQLKHRPEAALVFYWKELHRQVRIKGTVEQLPDDVADNYFASRPRGSQISTLVATQSEVIPDQNFMIDRYRKLDKKYPEGSIPRPPAWLGYRVKPVAMEFWQGQQNRLHDRILYSQETDGNWVITRLAP